MDSAIKNPPRELANIPPEKYTDYKNLILADYSISHARDISQQLKGDDKGRFEVSVLGEISKILGRKPVNWPDIVDPK